MDNAAFDDEGRVTIADFGGFVLVNAYFPNSQAAGARLDYKLAFNKAILEKLDGFVASGKHILLVGDYNVSHTPIDLAHPDTNEENPGYLPEERAWFSSFLEAGYVDVFRHFHPGETGCYTWWSMRAKGARERNVGWRLDYTCVDAAFMPQVGPARIRPEVMGADHCPVDIVVKV
jgi:exodeoxyribonuclease-3